MPSYMILKNELCGFMNEKLSILRNLVFWGHITSKCETVTRQVFTSSLLFPTLPC